MRRWGSSHCLVAFLVASASFAIVYVILVCVICLALVSASYLYAVLGTRLDVAVKLVLILILHLTASSRSSPACVPHSSLVLRTLTAIEIPLFNQDV